MEYGHGGDRDLSVVTGTRDKRPYRYAEAMRNAALLLSDSAVFYCQATHRADRDEEQ